MGYFQGTVFTRAPLVRVLVRQPEMLDCARRGDACVAFGCSTRARLEDTPKPASGRHPSRYDRAGCLARMTYSFGAHMLDLGEREALQEAQLDELSLHDQSKPQIAGLKTHWAEECGRRPHAPRLWRTCVVHVLSSFVASAWYNFLESATRVLQPVLLRDFLVWIERDDASDAIWRGLGLALALGVLSFLQAHVHHKLFYFGMRMGFNLKVATTGAVYDKVLRLSSGALRQATAGHAVNLVSNDVARFDSFCPFVHFMWAPLLDLVAVAGLMVSQVGWEAAMAGVASCVVLVPLQMYFAKRFATLRGKTAAFTDRRVKLTGELVNGIGTVKTFGWEQPYMDRVRTVRNRERRTILRSQTMKAFNLAVYFSNVAIASLVTFTVYFGNNSLATFAFLTSSISLGTCLRIIASICSCLPRTPRRLRNRYQSFLSLASIAWTILSKTQR